MTDKPISIDIQTRFSSITLFALLLIIDIIIFFIFLSGNSEQSYFINPKSDYRLGIFIIFLSIFGFFEIFLNCFKRYANKILIYNDKTFIIWKNGLGTTKKQCLNNNDIQLFKVKLIISTIVTSGRYNIKHSHLFSETEVEINLKNGEHFNFKEQPSQHLKKYNIKFFKALFANRNIIPNFNYCIEGNADFKINELKTQFKKEL